MTKVVKHKEYNTYLEVVSFEEVLNGYEQPIRIKSRKLKDKKKPGRSSRTAWN